MSRSTSRKTKLLPALGLALGSATTSLLGCPSSPGDAAGSGGAASAPAWQVVFDNGALDRALLSVWGTSAKSVFAVGGPLGNAGLETLVLHFDGSKWKDLHIGGTETFWWVNGTADNDVWMVGEQGRISHYDGSQFTESTSGVTSTLWGVFAFSKTDVWAVGGAPEGKPTDDDDVVLRYDGSSWMRVTLPGAPLHRALFKVWGTSSDDLYVVGEASTIWHKEGDTWTLESNPPLADGTLFTVWGCSADEVYAVGGRSVLRRDAMGWSKLDVTLSNGVNGVSCASPHSPVVVGFGGLKQRLNAKGQWLDDFADEPHGDLHSVWADDRGGFWAVGGDFISSPKPNQPRNGIVTRYGSGTVSSDLE